jgi:dinuclear metal center YbgI/SA1388 family protein
MICREILEKLEEKYPLDAAEDWDNPGLLIGADDREIRKIYLTLDVTGEAVEEAVEWGADLVISHHPMLFSSIKQINNRKYPGKKILSLIENRIGCYAMHTNFDVCAMAQINAGLLKLSETQVLYVTDRTPEGEKGIGKVGKLPRPMTLSACAEYVKTQYGLPHVNVYGNPDQMVEIAAVSGGSGKSMIDPALDKGAQVLITGDIDHHTGIDSVDQGLTIIDAGHYGTEYFFMAQVRQDLEQMDESLEIRSAEVKLPYKCL